MHPKIKSRPVAVKASVKPLLLHDVLNQAGSANDASRHGKVANQPASGTANHSRHHVSRHTQS
jgi:hypothetical protein